MKTSKALTWDDLADIHDKTSPGNPARTRPMQSVFEWAKQQKDKFWVNPDGGTLHRRLK